jgi:hypothetical protein
MAWNQPGNNGQDRDPWVQRCWLPSLTPVTYLRKLPGIHSVAALLKSEILGPE